MSLPAVLSTSSVLQFAVLSMSSVFKLACMYEQLIHIFDLTFFCARRISDKATYTNDIKVFYATLVIDANNAFCHFAQNTLNKSLSLIRLSTFSPIALLSIA